MTRRRIYVASSWKNSLHPRIIRELRAEGHRVYDYRETNFHFSDVSQLSRPWSGYFLSRVLEHTYSRDAFTTDFNELKQAEATLLLLPSGRSAHLELGYAVGVGQRTAILMQEPDEPELMYSMLSCKTILESIADVLEWAER